MANLSPVLNDSIGARCTDQSDVSGVSRRLSVKSPNNIISKILVGNLGFHDIVGEDAGPWAQRVQEVGLSGACLTREPVDDGVWLRPVPLIRRAAHCGHYRSVFAPLAHSTVAPFLRLPPALTDALCLLVGPPAEPVGEVASVHLGEDTLKDIVVTLARPPARRRRSICRFTVSLTRIRSSATPICVDGGVDAPLDFGSGAGQRRNPAALGDLRWSYPGWASSPTTNGTGFGPAVVQRPGLSIRDRSNVQSWSVPIRYGVTTDPIRGGRTPVRR